MAQRTRGAQNNHSHAHAAAYFRQYRRALALEHSRGAGVVVCATAAAPPRDTCPSRRRWALHRCSLCLQEPAVTPAASQSMEPCIPGSDKSARRPWPWPSHWNPATVPCAFAALLVLAFLALEASRMTAADRAAAVELGPYCSGGSEAVEGWGPIELQPQDAAGDDAGDAGEGMLPMLLNATLAAFLERHWEQGSATAGSGWVPCGEQEMQVAVAGCARVSGGRKPPQAAVAVQIWSCGGGCQWQPVQHHGERRWRLPASMAQAHGRRHHRPACRAVPSPWHAGGQRVAGAGAAPVGQLLLPRLPGHGRRQGQHHAAAGGWQLGGGRG